jgi:hypothetical protein
MNTLESNQPPTLVAWRKNDIFFGPQGALAFQKDLKDVEVGIPREISVLIVDLV